MARHPHRNRGVGVRYAKHHYHLKLGPLTTPELARDVALRPSLLSNAATVSANGYVYISVGGKVLRDSAFYSKLSSDGTHGSWNATDVISAANESTHSEMLALDAVNYKSYRLL